MLAVRPLALNDPVVLNPVVAVINPVEIRFPITVCGPLKVLVPVVANDAHVPAGNAINA